MGSRRLLEFNASASKLSVLGSQFSGAAHRELKTALPKAQPLGLGALVVRLGEVDIDCDSVGGDGGKELNELISAVGNCRHGALRAPIMLKRKTVKLIAVEDGLVAHIQSWDVAAGVDRVVPGLAVVDDVLRGSGPVDAFEIAPNAYTGGESDLLSIVGRVLAILLAQGGGRRPSGSADVLHGHQREAGIQDVYGLLGGQVLRGLRGDREISDAELVSKREELLRQGGADDSVGVEAQNRGSCGFNCAWKHG